MNKFKYKVFSLSLLPLLVSSYSLAVDPVLGKNNTISSSNESFVGGGGDNNVVGAMNRSQIIGSNNTLGTKMYWSSIYGYGNYLPEREWSARDSQIIGYQNTVLPKGVGANDGAYKHAILGERNQSFGTGTIVGSSNASYLGAVVVGERSKAFGERSMALGVSAESYGLDSIAQGFGAKALDTDAIAFGGYTEANGIGAIAIGHKANSIEAGVALGYRAKADRDGGQIAYMPTLISGQADNLKEILIKEGSWDKYNELTERLKEFEAYERVVRGMQEAQSELQSTENAQIAAWKELIKIDPRLAKNKEKFEQAYAKFLTAKDDVNKARDERMKIFWNTQAELSQEEFLRQKREYENIIAERHRLLSGFSSSYAAVSVGNSERGETRQIINVAGGTKDTDAVNVKQLKNTVELLDNNMPVIYTTQDGQRVYRNTDGQFHNEEGNNITPDQVKVVLRNAEPMIMSNVKEGIDDNDAVNVKQLNVLHKMIQNQAGVISQRVTNLESQAGVISQRVTNLESQAGVISQRVTNLESKVDKLDRKMKGGLATQAALGGLFQPYSIKRLNLTAGVGTYNSSVAVAVGAGYRFNEKWALKAGLSTSSGASVFSSHASVNYEF